MDNKILRIMFLTPFEEEFIGTSFDIAVEYTMRCREYGEATYILLPTLRLVEDIDES